MCCIDFKSISLYGTTFSITLWSQRDANVDGVEVKTAAGAIDDINDETGQFAYGTENEKK